MFKTEQKKRKSRILHYAFTVEPLSHEDIADVIPVVISWIIENIGPYNKKVWQIRHAMGTQKFLSVYFAKEKDAAAFKLFWM